MKRALKVAGLVALVALALRPRPVRRVHEPRIPPTASRAISSDPNVMTAHGWLNFAKPGEPTTVPRFCTWCGTPWLRERDTGMLACPRCDFSVDLRGSIALWRDFHRHEEVEDVEEYDDEEYEDEEEEQ